MSLEGEIAFVLMVASGVVVVFLAVCLVLLWAAEQAFMGRTSGDESGYYGERDGYYGRRDGCHRSVLNLGVELECRASGLDATPDPPPVKNNL